MLILRTLGGLALTAGERDVGNATAQRRPMALLAVLAAAAGTAISRERLAGLLWPDSEPERARRSVAQALYTLRKATGTDDVVVGTTELRLNEDVVASDLAAFRGALAAGRLAEAVEAYRGPFLDGFYIPGAVDFERWMEAERERLAHEYARALDALARRAESEGNLAEVVSARRRLVALDPLDSSATLALMDALERVGDVAGALRVARIHETLLGEEFELSLPAAVRDRVAALQAAPAASVTTAPALMAASVPSTSVPIATPSGSTAPAGPAGGSEHADSAVVSTPPTAGHPESAHIGAAADAPERVGRRRRAWWTLAAAPLAAALVVLGLVVGLRLGRGREASPPVLPSAALRANVLAVLPFDTDSADRSLAYLGEGVADALSRMVGGGAGPRVLDPGTVFAAAERLGTGQGATGSNGDRRRHARDVGRALGAGEVLIGRVAGTPERVTLTASLVDVGTDERRAAASVSGPVDSLATLLDGLATRLVAGRAVGGERASTFSGTSLRVLRAYLDAEAALRDDRVEETVRLYERALAGDSTFAPAALGLAEAADRFNAAEQHDRALALAWAARDRLGERDRAYLTALAGPAYPSPSTTAEQLAAWEQAVALAPDRAVAWSELAERLLYDGPALGLRTATDRAAAALRRALELDPDYAPALRTQVELAALVGDTATLRRIATPERLRAFGGDLTGYLLWRVATVRHDTAALTRLHERLTSLGIASLRAIAMAAQHTGLGRDEGERALRVLTARAALGAEQLDVLLAQHSLALNQGRPVLALDVTERLQDAQPGSRAHLRLRVLDALYASGDTAAATAAAQALARVVDAGPARDPYARALQLADECVLGQWWVARLRGTRGDDAEAARVRAAIASLRQAPLPRRFIPVEVTPPACATMLETSLAVALRAPNARQLVERFDALMLTGPAIGDARTYAHLVVSRLYQRLGDRAHALASIRQRAYLRGWPRYLATSLWEESRLALAAGDSVGAAAALRRYLSLRDDPEAPVRLQADSARAVLARVETAHAGR